MPGRGRPRLTPADYEERLRSYCSRYAVAATPAGIPPFPTGQRETDQHREWMALYRVHSRLFEAPARLATSDAAPTAACPVCGRVTDASDSVPYRSAVLHRACLAVVSAVEPLGAAGFERLRAFLWPDASRRPDQRRRRS